MESGLSERDQGANLALMELYKDLCSAKPGEQCEAIVKFPRVFEKYPFPILINSACMKLSELFHIGTNFHRIMILKVMQQTQKHLDKILNVDEFVHSIYAVIYSNDPVARALTLRILGSIASIVAEKKNIHHSIRISLDSHDAVEMKAAIFAAGKFAAQSRTFASNICGKIGQMIHGLAMPVEVKLQSLSVLQHMHHNGEMIAQVWKLCTSLLPDYPAQQFVICILHTLTELAAACITLIPKQVNLLISYLKEDAQSCVKVNSLQDMKKLANKGAHLWSIENVEELVNYALETPYDQLRCEVLNVLVALASSVAVDKFDLTGQCKVLELCQDCIFMDKVKLSALAIELMTQIAVHVFQEHIIVQGMDLMQDVSNAIETLMFLICTLEDNKELYYQPLTTCFRCIVSICDVNSELCVQYVDVLGSLITQSSDIYLVPLCTALCALGNKRAGIIICWQSELIAKLKALSTRETINTETQKAMVVMCTLLFQANIDNPSILYYQYNPESMVSAIESMDLWSSYRIGRQAARYGHYHYALRIFSSLCDRVSSEHFYFWFISLCEISMAENCMMSSVNTNFESCKASLSKAVTHYSKAVVSLRASTSPIHSPTFQCEYAHLRREVLQAYLQLLLTCLCTKTSPPPAIANSMADATRDELQKCGKVVIGLRKCAKDFHALANQYKSLYQSRFDLDPKTLVNIQLLHQSCLLIVQALDKVALHKQGISFSSGEGEILSLESTKQSLENYKMAEACRKASILIQGFKVNCDDKFIAKREADFLINIGNEMFLVPLCLPRFFFQTLQSTTVKLAISPLPKVTGEPIIIQNTTQLAIKVEGVVQHGSRPGLYRKVDKLVINVASSAQNPIAQTDKLASEDSANNMLSQSVTPHYDYFQAQFLLAFPVSGLHTVSIETSIMDEEGALWKTGPKRTLNVKSYDTMDVQKPTPCPTTSGY